MKSADELRPIVIGMFTRLAKLCDAAEARKLRRPTRFTGTTTAAFQEAVQVATKPAGAIVRWIARDGADCRVRFRGGFMVKATRNGDEQSPAELLALPINGDLQRFAVYSTPFPPHGRWEVDVQAAWFRAVQLAAA